MLDAATVSAYRFHRAHGGGIVGEAARCALEVARAEVLLERARKLGVASVAWHDDDDRPYDYNPRGRGFEDADADYVRRRFESGAWTGPFGVVVEVGSFAGCTCGAGDDARYHVTGCPVADDDAPVVDVTAERSLWGIVVGPRGTDDPYCRVVVGELASELVEDLRQAVGDARDALEGVTA